MSRVNSIIGTNIGTTIRTNFILWNWFCYSVKHVKNFALSCIDQGQTMRITPKFKGQTMWITPKFKGQLWDKTSLKWTRN